MIVNVLDILKLLGWEIIEANNEKHQYTITESNERLQRETENEGVLYGETTVMVEEVSFDMNGNLYILFSDAQTGEYVDNYLHNHMEKQELYA